MRLSSRYTFPVGPLRLISLLFLLSTTSLYAQIDAEKLPPLLELPGGGAAVRYSPGSLDRASHVLMRLEMLAYYFGKWSERPIPLASYVFSREQWDDLNLPRPYGFPVRMGPAAIAVAAEGDEGTVGLWRSLLGVRDLPMVPGIPLRGTSQHAATLALADVLLQLEACRAFAQRTGLVGEAPWVGELMAQTVALSAFSRQEEGRIPEIVWTYRQLTKQLGGDRAYSLATYSASLPVEEWLWYQGQFFLGAEHIIGKGGKKTVKQLLKQSDKAGGRVVVEGLLRRYPALSDWMRTSFAPLTSASAE